MTLATGLQDYVGGLMLYLLQVQSNTGYGLVSLSQMSNLFLHDFFIGLLEADLNYFLLALHLRLFPCFCVTPSWEIIDNESEIIHCATVGLRFQRGSHYFEAKNHHDLSENKRLLIGLKRSY